MGMLFALALAQPLPAAGQGCAELVTDRQAGEVIAPADLRRVACTPSRKGLVRFDTRSRTLRATGFLAAGTSLGRVFAGDPVVVRAGDRVMIEARMGHAVLRRQVTALQRARNGQRFFVRADDGTTFVAPAVGEMR